MTLTDCDGVALKDRTINLEVTGGTLDNNSVTTDDNGKATVNFTAGNTPTVAQISPVMPFQHPTGSTDVADATPAYIEISKPKDDWYFQATYKETNTTTDKQEYPTLGGIQNSNTEDDITIHFAGYAKNIAPPILANSFIPDPTQFIYI